MRARRRGAAAAIACAIAIAACGGGGATTTTTASTSTTQSTVAGSASSTSTTAKPSLDGVSLKLTDVASVAEPTALAFRAGSTSLFVTEKVGRVREITVTKDERTGKVTYKLATAPLLDLTKSITSASLEQGLLGLVFSSDGRKLYVDYTAAKGGANTVDELTMQGDKVDLKSRRTLLSVPDKYSNHNGGQLQIGPDGYLYIAMGDGGSQGDPDNNGQNTDVLLAKILRIDPEAASAKLPYGIPDGNPFAGGGGRPEVWLYGVRNPWRFSFDSGTADLWIGDVGGSQIEEIDLLPAADGGGRGANLGWSQVEGTQKAKGKNPSGAILPIHEYSHSGGACAVIGGYVYRGKAMPGLQGAYLYADSCVAKVNAIRVVDGKIVAERSFTSARPGISSFGEGPDRELYVLSLGGAISRIDPG